ncbi:hypothetical protein MKW92_046682 [Papaver armeniacum]|nr:hypothetical protein MKW92_046682 [Papaver armeniacum]
MEETGYKRRKLVEDDQNHSKILNESADKKDPSAVDEAPYVIVVHGPPKVGKSLLIKSLIKHYRELYPDQIRGPITIPTGDQRRIQFVECPNNMNGMIDAAKYADAVILLIDANYGFEMETFEFLNLLQVHGMPKVVGVLTYLDELEDAETRKIIKERVMNKFRTNIHERAIIFCLSGVHHGMYHKNEIDELANFLSEFHTLPRRAAHPYLLVDHFEDVTSPALVHMDGKCKRDIILYGYLRGCDIKKGTKVHIAGVGDYPVADVTISADPCPLPPVNGYDKKMQINIVHNDLDEESRFEIDSFRLGTYLRFRVLGVPFEMVANHDPCQPILVGGISRAEDNVGHMQVRLTQHSWHTNRLKTKDPIIVSVGWRRYQTTPIYYQDSNGRHEMLEYTPEDQPCLATFWGPLAPSGAGVVAVRSLAENKAPFRILATAELLDLNHTVKIVEKIKRIGTPCLILNETALIKDMFRSDDEVDQFRDVKVQTACGIQGEINEAAKPYLLNFVQWNDGQPREGIAKCTFDRIIHMSDTILMFEWTQVEVPCIFKTAPELSNRVWQCMDETEESKAHALVIVGKNVAPEDRRKLLTDVFGKKPNRRQTLEQRRAVIIERPRSFDLQSRKEWVRRMMERRSQKLGPGMITTGCMYARLET